MTEEKIYSLSNKQLQMEAAKIRLYSPHGFTDKQGKLMYSAPVPNSENIQWIEVPDYPRDVTAACDLLPCGFYITADKNPWSDIMVGISMPKNEETHVAHEAHC